MKETGGSGMRADGVGIDNEIADEDYRPAGEIGRARGDGVGYKTAAEGMGHCCWRSESLDGAIHSQNSLRRK